MFKNKLKYHCNKCGHIEVKRVTFLQELFSIVKILSVICILTTSFLGIMALYNFATSSPFNSYQDLFQVGSAYASMANIKSHFITTMAFNELQTTSEGLISNCTEGDDYCKVVTIYQYMNQTFQYQLGTDLDPIDILREKRGDCDEQSNLLMMLLRAQNIDSHLQCSPNHCWIIVNLKDKTILADLTMQRWIEQ